MPMIAAALRAFRELFTPPFRSVLYKSLGLTVALLVVAMVAIQAAFAFLVVLPGWIETTIQIVGGLGLVVLSVFLVAPISALIAGLYVDEAAEAVERSRYADHPPGRALGAVEGLGISVRFGLVVLGVNILVLFLLLLPGINVMAFFIGNGYLLGREFFEMAAMRYMPAREARAFRKQNRIRVFLSGLIIAGLVSVPLLNLLTPLFAIAFMVHTVKALMGRQPREATGTVPSVRLD